MICSAMSPNVPNHTLARHIGKLALEGRCRRPAIGSVVDYRNRLDLDQPPRPHQAAHDNKRTGRRLGNIEIVVAYRAHFRNVGLIDLGGKEVISDLLTQGSLEVSGSGAN
jgi:hypothetical protein